MSYQVINPFIQFVDPINGKPLSGGYVYFGRKDTDPKNQPANRVNVYAVQDNGTEVLLAQPITLNGAGQPQYSGSVKQIKVELYAGESAYAIQVFSSSGSQKGYSPRVDSYIDTDTLASYTSTVEIAGQQAQYILKIKTLADAVNDDAPIGANYEISDRGGAACVVVAAGDVGGIYLASLVNGNKLRLKSTSLFVNEQNVDPSKYNLAVFGGALRRTPFSGSNKWEWVQDSAHEPQGVSATITDLDAYQFQINYSNAAGNRVKVGTTLLALDYELAPYGVMTGANGGINSSIYQMYAPCRLFIESLSLVTASPLWISSGLSISYAAGVITVGHAPRALNVDPPVISRVAPAAGSQHNAVYDVQWGATSTTITAYDYIGGLVQYNGSIMTVSGSKNINLSASVSGGVVTVTHDSVDGDFIPQLTMFGSSAYIPHVLSVNATTVQIGFKDTSGTLITAPNASMSFYISRNGLVKSAIDSGVRMCVDLGLCRVKSADVGNISLNNWWVIGFNNATV